MSTWVFRFLVCFLLSLLHAALSNTSKGFYPTLYPCPFHSAFLNKNGSLGASLVFDGSPESYQPLSIYHATIFTSVQINRLEATGIIASEFNDSKLCFPIYTHLSPLPSQTVSFYWIAPPSGSGCVLIAVSTYSLSHIVLNNVILREICEVYQLTSDFHSSGKIFYENFDSAPLDRLWSADRGGFEIQRNCSVGSGKAAVFCNMRSETRHLITKPINTTYAETLQFLLGIGSCGSSKSQLQVFYHKDEIGEKWSLMGSFRASGLTRELVLDVPPRARGEQVQFKFSEKLPFEGCWAIDEIVVISGKNRPDHIEEDMDEKYGSGWVTPGVRISVRWSECASTGNALIVDVSAGASHVTTRDIDLSSGETTSLSVEDVEEKGSVHQKDGHQAKVVRIFNQSGARTLCTGPSANLKGKTAVSFVLSTGSQNCSETSNNQADVKLYYVTREEEHLLQTFHYFAYKIPRRVTVPFSEVSQSRDVKLCFRQENQSSFSNIWAVDSIRLSEEQKNYHHFIQFSINLACSYPLSTVKLQFSTDLGKSWKLVRSSCLSRQCFKKHWNRRSIYNVEELGQGWRRVIVTMPEAALTSATRFRWIGNATNFTSKWAIDDVYIGSDAQCPRMCSGRGFCSFNGCKCDDGYIGRSCDVAITQLSTFLADDFDSGQVNHELFEKAVGCSVGFQCGIVGSEKALVFSKSGPRLLVTRPLNASTLRFVQFTILTGRYSAVGTCRKGLPHETKWNRNSEDVLVQYSTNHGLQWNFLYLVEFDTSHKAGVVSLDLPNSAKQPGLQIRWIQTQDNSLGVWAIDDIIIASSLFKTAYATSMNFDLGTIQFYCGKESVLTFSSEIATEQVRYAETESLHVTQGYVLQTNVVMNCDRGGNRSLSINSTNFHNVLEVQYSTDHGREWTMVQKFTPPHATSPFTPFHSPSVLHESEFKRWNRVTFALRQETWSDHTRFRIIQNNVGNAGSWAIDEVYMGPGCPLNCRNHGDCRNGACICDAGYNGASCLPDRSLPTGVDIRFDDLGMLVNSGWVIIGGNTSNGNRDRSCRPMPSSSYLRFFKGGLRMFTSTALDLREGGQMQFYIRVGATDCIGANNKNNSVFFQYSIDGGATWYYIQEFYSTNFSSGSYAHFYISEKLRQPYVVFRWWQPWNQGENFDVWDIDDVVIGQRVRRSSLFRGGSVNTRDVNDDDEDRIIISSSDHGAREEYCSPRESSLTFNHVEGDRFATSDDYDLRKGDLLEFEINIGCSTNFSDQSPVKLQYSHDAGYTWNSLHRSCSSLRNMTSQCVGAEEQIFGLYYQGEYEKWTRIVVVITAEVAARKVRFRWYQSTLFTAAPWALDNIYIGPSCPERCMGHGSCAWGGDDPQCRCDDGYEVNEHGSCSPLSTHLESIWDTFNETMPWWKKILGGRIVDRGGNKVLCFDWDGNRLSETLSLDTLQSRLLHFRLYLSSQQSLESGEILVQYSLDGGIEWHTIKELRRSPTPNPAFELFTIDLPRDARSLSTSFRWWQPLRQGVFRPKWCIDDVIVGRGDLMENGFFDNFDRTSDVTSLNSDVWYGTAGSRVGTFFECTHNQSNGTVFSHRLQSVVFDSTKEEHRYLESWDFFLLSGSFVQFDLIMNCGEKNSPNQSIQLQYSTNLGRSWEILSPPCLQIPAIRCHLDFGSVYHQELNGAWGRHTVMVPETLRHKTIRFRWIQFFHNGSRWAIDNIYIGNKCEWMCGGFGWCEPSGENFACRCDDESQYPNYCGPNATVKSYLTEDFDYPWLKQGFAIVSGNKPIKEGEPSEVIVSKEHLEFSDAGIRLLQTTPVNTTDVRYLQFNIRFKRRHNASYVVVQSSINNGITWETLDIICSNSNEQDKFVHIKIKQAMRRSATVFRWWQLNINSDVGEMVWSLDDLVIGGRATSCEPYFFQDNFETISKERWLFTPGGTISEYCSDHFSERLNKALKFRGDTRNQYAMTRDLCVVKDNYVIQFYIAVGCDDNNTSRRGVRLEFSVDDGLTWDLVEPHCFGNGLNQLGCGVDYNTASIYYSGSWWGWRRVIIPLRQKTHISEGHSTRFRWVKEIDPNSTFSWAINEVYIGPGCPQGCNGHGYCDSGSCRCDDGFSGETCCDVLDSINPKLIVETFDHGLISAGGAWLQASGGSPLPSTCSTALFLNNRFIMNQPGIRLLMTKDIDASRQRFVQFYMKKEAGRTILDGSQCGGKWDAEEIVLQYSKDGGVSWQTMQVIKNLSLNQAVFFAIPFPENARSNATRLRWWQPSISGEYQSDWSIDHVVINGDAKDVEDDFTRLNHEIWVELASSSVSYQKSCCSSFGPCASLQIGGQNLNVTCGRSWASTVGVAVGPGSYVQFHAQADCARQTYRCHDLLLEFSLDFGYIWDVVKRPCLPFDPQCSESEAGSRFSSSQFVEEKRVVVVLPEATWSPATRFRWRITGQDLGASWHLDDVYVGDGCWRACGGHGRCHSGLCECDEGWQGPECKIPSELLPFELKDNFEQESKNQFPTVVGGERSTSWGDLAFGHSLHFNQSCSRLLVSRYLDTRASEFLQFYFRFECLRNLSSHINQSVLVDFSRNGAISWKALAQIRCHGNDHVRFVNIRLPDAAKGLGVSFRWWQPVHGAEGEGSWQVDNIALGGGRRATLSDNFTSSRQFASTSFYLDRNDFTMWMFYDNTDISSYCERHPVVLSGIRSGLDVIIGTKDFIIENDFILQYSIAVGCRGSAVPRHQPVHVQFSIDFGVTWQYVRQQCSPLDRKCFGREATQPSVHFITSSWRRTSLKLGDLMEGRTVRFRWVQFQSDVEWALSHVFIGPECPRSCFGNGDCILSDGRKHCVCDEGYFGEDCSSANKHKNFVKDSFNNKNHSIRMGQWALIEGGGFSRYCGQLVDGTSLVFGGIGPRQAQTVPMDLRDARFIQYHAVIGSSLNSSCLPARTRSDGVLLEYSTDGGMFWKSLRVLDYLSFPSPTHNYVELPQDARTRFTLIRWWQPYVIDLVAGLVSLGENRASWALDDVYVGGHEINTPVLEENFEAVVFPGNFLNRTSEENLDFYPSGFVARQYCGVIAPSNIMAWPVREGWSSEQSLATRQLIVTQGFMIQFKIVVGCAIPENPCLQRFKIILQYRNSPRAEWSRVLEECFPDFTQSFMCAPFQYHGSSVYGPEGQWKRITLPLDSYHSETAQFRWFQAGISSTNSSWALDDIFIGEACPSYCSGHGACVAGKKCVCDYGFSGLDCSVPETSRLIQNFKDDFEIPIKTKEQFSLSSLNRSHSKWDSLRGGIIGHGGCGALGPFGFGRNVYFNSCGKRRLRTVEMDLRRGSFIQYVIQIGSIQPRSSCHVNVSRGASVLLQYTINNGVTWVLLKEHRAGLFRTPKRIAVKFPKEAKTALTALRWWQPQHGGAGEDQWALDNAEIVTSPLNRYMNSIHAPLESAREVRNETQS